MFSLANPPKMEKSIAYTKYIESIREQSIEVKNIIIIIHSLALFLLNTKVSWKPSFSLMVRLDCLYEITDVNDIS